MTNNLYNGDNSEYIKCRKGQQDLRRKGTFYNDEKPIQEMRR